MGRAVRLSALVNSICLSLVAGSIALSVPARANDVFSSDVFASNDPHRDFEIEIMSYGELMAQTPTVRAAYIKNLQGMYLEALELEAKNPRIPDAVGSNSKLQKIYALLEAFSTDAQAMGGGGASRSGAEVSARIDAERAAADVQDRQATAESERRLTRDAKAAADAVVAAQASIEQCKATPKPVNCTARTIQNRQSHLEELKKESAAADAKLKAVTEHAAVLSKPKPAAEVASPNANIDMSPGAASKATEDALKAKEAYDTAKLNFDNCEMRPAPSECTIPEKRRRKETLDRTEKAWNEARAKMPSDPRSEPKDSTRPGEPSSDTLAAAHAKNVSCRKDVPPVVCTRLDEKSPAAIARAKKIADYERKSATRKSCTTGFLDSNFSGSCQNVHSLKVGKVELKCETKTTTLCNPWMYGAAGYGTDVKAICGDVPAKGTSQQKAVEIAKSCGDKSAKLPGAIDNFLANSKITGVKEGWEPKIRQPLSQLCGGPLRMEANCEVCQKLAAGALLSISKSGAIRKCDAPAAGAGANTVVK